LNIPDKFSSVQVEVNPLTPVDPCSIPASSDLMPSYMQIFGPAQGSSCSSVYPTVFQVCSDKWDIKLFEDMPLNMVVVLSIE